MAARVSFRGRSRLKRFFVKLLRRRRSECLASRCFHARPRFKEFFNPRQKIIFFLIVLMIGSIIGFSQFSGFFDVTKVSIERSSLDVPIREIEMTVRQLALGKNILTVNTADLIDAVKKMRPDASRVEIKKKYPHEIRVKIFKFPIVAEFRENTETIFVNENGFRVLGDTPDRDILTLSFGEKIDLTNLIDQIIDSKHLAKIRDAVFYFESLTGFKILNVKYFPISREAHFKIEKNYNIWIDITGDYRQQLDKLVDAGDALDLENRKYEYIDLRVRGKIFYKPKS